MDDVYLKSAFDAWRLVESKSSTIQSVRESLSELLKRLTWTSNEVEAKNTRLRIKQLNVELDAMLLALPDCTKHAIISSIQAAPAHWTLSLGGWSDIQQQGGLSTVLAVEYVRPLVDPRSPCMASVRFVIQGTSEANTSVTKMVNPLKDLVLSVKPNVIRFESYRRHKAHPRVRP